MSRSQQRRLVRPGELLAIRHDFVQSDRGAFFWLFGPAVRENERIGDLAVVCINGPMEHHDDGMGESYELILNRARAAFTGEGCEEGPPKCVALRIDSPGGVVAGLNECVRSLRRMSKETKIPLIAFTDEMAASAAYALCCAADHVCVTKSSVVGSVGVISTMVDQVGFDKKQGFRFVVLASGERKADGHVHVPISKDAIAAEEPRVQELAAQFWAMVSRARGIPVAQVRGYEAAIFLGEEAVEAELADEVGTWDDIVATYGGTDPLAQPGTTVPTSRSEADDEDVMLSAEQSLRNAIAKEKDPTRLSALKAALDAYKKETHQIEKHTKEEGEEEEEAEDDEAKGNETRRTDDEDEKDEDDDQEDEKDSKKSSSSKKSAKSKSKKSEEEEEEAASEEDEAEALAAQVRRATGKSGAAARGALDALLSKAKQADTLAQRIDKIERDNEAKSRDAVVDGALAQRRISKRESASLKNKPMAYVQAFLEARPRALFNAEGDEAHPILRQTDAKGNAFLPPELEKQLEQAVLASEGKITREQILETHYSRQGNGKQNGAP